MGVMILVPGADYSGVSLGKATPAENIPIEGITINGPGAAYNTADYTAKVWPVFTNQREFTWSVTSGGNYASISSEGRLTVAAGASQQPVTIRCTSTENPNVYGEKTILCSAGELVYYDWIQGDGEAAYILINRFTSALYNTKITVKYTLGTIGNHYLFMSYSQIYSNNAARLALYLQDNTTNSRVMIGNTIATVTSTNAKTRKHRAEFTTSSNSTTPNATFYAYDDDTGDLLYSKTDTTFIVNSYLCLFNYGSADNAQSEFSPANYPGNGKFYGMVVEKDNEVLADYRPATVDGTPCVIDYISGLVYYNAAETGAFTVGNDE